MPRKASFVFDDASKRQLVECLRVARLENNGNALMANLTAEFLKLQPDCKLIPKTLYNRAAQFEKELKAKSDSSEESHQGEMPNYSTAQETKPEMHTASPSSTASRNGHKNPNAVDQGFEWDENKKKVLVGCLENARKIKGSKNKIEVRVKDEFVKTYPNCPIKATTLYRYSLDLYPRKVQTLNPKGDEPSKAEPPNYSIARVPKQQIHKVPTLSTATNNEHTKPNRVNKGFDWDEEKEKVLVRCLKKARNIKGSKDKIAIRVRDEFVKTYPNCPIKAATLYSYSLDLYSGKVQTLNPKEAKKRWTNDKELFLIECAQTAFQENKKRIRFGVYEGRFGVHSDFIHILTDLFQETYPTHSAYAIRGKFQSLQQKLNLKFEEAPHTMSGRAYSAVMSMWDSGFKLSALRVFQGCCYVCSTLLVSHPGHNTFRTEASPSDVPVLNYYRDDYLRSMYKKGDSRYYLCGICKKNDLLQRFPLAPEGTLSLTIPFEIYSLNNYEKLQIALAALFSETVKVKNPSFGTYEHKQGSMDAIHKNDQRYFNMYAMIVEKTGINDESASDIKIRAALKKLKEINPLYSQFYAHYETLYRYVKPRPNQPSTIAIFDKRDIEIAEEEITKNDVLGDEEAGLLIPQFDLAARGTEKMADAVAAAQHCRDFEEAKKSLKRLLWVNYDEPTLAAKLFPWLHPYGIGGYEPRKGMTMGNYYKWRLCMADDRFRREPNYMFYFLDLLIKTRIQVCNSLRVSVADLAQPLTKKDFNRTDNLGDSKYGREVPASIPNSKTYWYTKAQDLLALSAHLGRQPDLFITLTQNDNWPEMVAIIADGIHGKAEIASKEDMMLAFGTKEAVRYPVEMAMVFYRRLQAFKNQVLHNEKGIFGKVTDYWYRIEYQNRGGLHVHCVIWCEPSTVPEDAIVAEIPRFVEHPNNDQWRDMVKALQIHRCCVKCRTIGPKKMLEDCKYGFPFATREVESTEKKGLRFLYVRRHSEDIRVVPHNLALLMFWGAHVNVQRVTDNGWEMYLTKYIAKSAVSVKININKKQHQKPLRDMNDAERYLRTRVVSSLECAALLLQKPHVQCSNEIIFLPIDVNPRARFVKRNQHMTNVEDDSDDIYYQTKLEKYLDRPRELQDLTYSQFYARYYYSSSKNTNDGEEQDENLPSVPNTPRNDNVLVDRSGRQIRRRVRKEAVTYFKHYVPYGDELELYCLRKLLENVPVDGESLHRLRSDTGSYLDECMERSLIEKEEEAMHFLKESARRGYSADKIMEMARRMIEGNWLMDQDVDALLETIAPKRAEMEELIRAEIIDVEDESNVLNVKEPLPLHEYLDKFSESQRQAYEYVTSGWARGEKVKAMVAGEAGAGKSFLMEALYSYCRENDMRVQKLATTGCAAHVVGGLTIHCYFKMGINLDTRLEFGTTESHMIANVDVIMIDEVSMLDMNLLSKIEELLRRHTELNRVPFGGKSIIMFGDAAQLPAINCNIWEQHVYAKHFDTLVLRQNMRAEDSDFQLLLNRIRVEKYTEQDLVTLERRLIKKEDIKQLDLQNTLYLVSLRRTKAAHDAAALEKLPGETIEILARDVDVRGTPVSDATAAYIKGVERRKNLLPSALKLKIGAKVMLLRNRDIRHGWVNGRIATVEHFNEDYIVVKSMLNGSKLAVTRVRQDILGPTGGSTYFREQFPLELAYAATIHKCQGQTLKDVIIDASRLFVTGQFYTAVSRVRNLYDLHFTQFSKSAIIVAPEIKDLLEWFDKVDVLRGFSGRKPLMPIVPPRWNATRETRDGKVVKVSMADLFDGIDEENKKDDSDTGGHPNEEKDEPDSRPERGAKRAKRTPYAEELASLKKDDLNTMFRFISRIGRSVDDDAYRRKVLEITDAVGVPAYISTLQESATTTYEANGGSTRPNEEAQRLLYSAMSTHSQAVATSGDGSCMFNMVSLNLFGHENYAARIRAATIRIFAEHWRHFEGMMMEYDISDMDTLVMNTSRHLEGEIGWGSNAHLKALAIATQREVYVYVPLSSRDADNKNASDATLQQAINEGTTQHVRYSPLRDRGQAPIMCILSNRHYSAILRRNNTSTIFVPNVMGDAHLRDHEFPPAVVEEIELDDDAVVDVMPMKRRNSGTSSAKKKTLKDARRWGKDFARRPYE